MKLNRAIQYLKSGDAVLFAGAGFSADAKASNGRSLPMGGQLIERIREWLANPAGLEGVFELDAAVSFAIDQKGPAAVLQFLKTHLAPTEIAGWQYDLCSLGWRRIYTTNFDSLIERASPGRRIFTHESKIDELRGNELVHLNGALDRVTVENFVHKSRSGKFGFMTKGLRRSA